MQNRKRIINILIAGTLSVLMLTVFLAFRGGDTAVAETSTTDQTAVIELTGEESSDVAALQAQIESLQAQNAALQTQAEAYQAQNDELRTAVATMQQREVEYQNQIEAANQTINELSAQNSSLAASGVIPPAHGHNH